MHRCCNAWCWLLNDIPSLAQLHHRHLSALRRERGSSSDCCQEHIRGRLSALCSPKYASSSSMLFHCRICRLYGLELIALCDRVVFHNLGIDWASTLIALVSVVMIPIPFMWVQLPSWALLPPLIVDIRSFYFYGFRIRARGKWSKASTM